MTRQRSLYQKWYKDDVTGSIFAAMKETGMDEDAEMSRSCQEILRNLGLAS